MGIDGRAVKRDRAASEVAIIHTYIHTYTHT
jgi:hypothetical protein